MLPNSTVKRQILETSTTSKLEYWISLNFSWLCNDHGEPPIPWYHSVKLHREFNWQFICACHSVTIWKFPLFSSTFFLCQSYIFFSFLFIYFWLCHETCGILVPRPGIKLTPTTVEVWIPNHLTIREVPSGRLNYADQCHCSFVFFFFLNKSNTVIQHVNF